MKKALCRALLATAFIGLTSAQNLPRNETLYNLVTGESGSGKSTLVQLLLRLLAATSGDAELLGKNVTKGPKHVYWREVQAVFQDPFASFNQFYSVRRVMLSALSVLKKQPNRA